MADAPPLDVSKLITYDDRQGPPRPLKRVPFSDILKQHRERFIVPTSQGDVVLRRIRQMDMEKVATQWFNKDPNLEKLAGQAADFLKMGEVSGDDLKRMLELEKELKPFYLAIAVYCFESPDLNAEAKEAGMEPSEILGVFYDMLLPNERKQIEELLAELTSPNARVVSAGPALIKLGVTCTEKLPIEEITAQQAHILGGKDA